MKRITDLQFLKIVTQEGDVLGRVFDLRSEGLPEHGLRHNERPITELVYGKIGLLARLGLRQAKAETLPWKFVKEIKNGRIVVGNNQRR